MFQGPASIHSDCRRQVAWHRLDKDDLYYLYTLPLECEICNILCPNTIAPEQIADDSRCHERCGRLDLDKIVSEITEKIFICSSNLPKEKYDRNLKPYWSKTLSELNAKNKNARNRWSNAGKHKDASNEYYTEYKNNKNIFRNEKRRSVAEYEATNMSMIEEMQDVDQKILLVHD